MIIDVHVHARNGVSVKQLARACRAVGIEKVVYMGEPERVLRSAKEAPEFIIPFAHVDLDSVTPEEARRWMEQGIAGFKIISPLRNYDDEAYFPIYERLEANGMIALFHTAVIAGSGSARQKEMRASSLDMRPGLLDRIARSFPDLVIVGAHLGYPWYLEACSQMRWHRNVYFDTSTCQLTARRPRYISEGPEESVKPYIRDLYLSGDLHPEKLLFGSDTFLDRENAVSVVDLAVRQHDVALDDLAAPEEVRNDCLLYTSPSPRD